MKWRNIFFMSLLSAWSLAALGQVPLPLSADSFQLQQLIQKSEEQVQLLREVLKTSRQDSDSLHRAQQILESLSEGLDQSIQEYQGSPLYHKALLEMQKEEGFVRTFEDGRRVRQWTAERGSVGIGEELAEAEFDNFVQFQKQSVLANEEDLRTQMRLQELLAVAPPAVVPKIQTQAQIGSWQSNTRVSAQLTELLGAIQAVREELRAQRLKAGSSDGLNTLIMGSEMQNQMHRERERR